jgi:hypothetical protein
MQRRHFIQGAAYLLASIVGRWRDVRASERDGDSSLLANEFDAPPDAAYPWMYGLWLEGNITEEGITSDLEAMRRAGIRGFTLMDGSIGNPPGPHRFLSQSWLGMFDHLLSEAHRLGLEVNLNNGPGDDGSGGPWVTPEQASQKVVVAATILEGPAHFAASLPRASGINRGYYRDIAVLTYPAPAGQAPSYRIPDYDSTKSFAGGQDFSACVPWPRFIATNPEWPDVPHDQILSSADMRDLSAYLDTEGKLVWEIPAGRWLVLRFGHTVANGLTRTVQPEAAGLECDKLSKAAVEAHFAAMVERLARRTGPKRRKTWVATHIDSWEAGSGNWTPGFREEFRRRRGYDLLCLLPVLDGIVVDSREVSERFLWDYRETVCELLLENYAQHMRELAHRQGLRLSIEAYDGTCDDLRYAGRADEPMGEFWRGCYSGLPLADLIESMASAGHVYGRSIIGAEAFTDYREDLLDHPATLKPLADWAFCTGVNRLCFHRWVFQPWPQLITGVGFVGTVFQQSLTWWEQSKPWHQYLARCQHLLRQGNFVADICYIAPEGAPYRFTPPVPVSQRGAIPDRPGYNFDGCPAELVIHDMRVEDGWVVLSSGMRYRLLVLPTYDAEGRPVIRLMDDGSYIYKPMPLPKVRTMTPALLRRIQGLVEAGATVLGHRPLKSPSLAGFPRCDFEVEQCADALWGENMGNEGTGQRGVGRGRVFWGQTPEQVLSGMGVAPDFSCEGRLQGRLNYTHRQIAGGMDLYFVANKEARCVEGVCAFRVTGKRPALYWPESGRSDPMLAFEERGTVTRLPICLQARESVFVVFRSSSTTSRRIVSVAHNGEMLWPNLASSSRGEAGDDAFALGAWVTPIDPGDKPPEGLLIYTEPCRARGGFRVDEKGITVFRYDAMGEPEPLLVHDQPLTRQTLVGVVYQAGVAKLYLNGRLVQTDPRRSGSPAHGDWSDHRPFAGEVAAFEQFIDLLASAGDTVLADGLRPANVTSPVDFCRREINQSGHYVFHEATGAKRALLVNLPPPQEISGAWEVEFDRDRGGAGTVIFESLTDWAGHLTPDIRYYSGPAIYRKTFDCALLGDRQPNSKIYLDLGAVAVVAVPTLNGKALGTLWKPPYRVDVTDVLKARRNGLTVSVVNLGINRLIGDERLPEDSERTAEGVLKSWPEWVLKGQPSPTGRRTFTTRRVWTKDDPLVRSGLLGPVRLLMVGRFS